MRVKKDNLMNEKCITSLENNVQPVIMRNWSKFIFFYFTQEAQEEQLDETLEEEVESDKEDESKIEEDEEVENEEDDEEEEKRERFKNERKDGEISMISTVSSTSNNRKAIPDKLGRLLNISQI